MTNLTTDVAAQTEYVIEASSPDNAVIDTSATFKLTMVEACLTSITLDNNPMTDTVYYINTSSLTPLVIDLPSYSPVPATCGQTIVMMPYLVTDTTYS